MKILTFLSYVGMVVINYLADRIPLGGVTTAEVSNLYLNLFAPAGYAFSIWGLIYALLGAFCIYQLFLTDKEENSFSLEQHYQINLFFMISSIANALWIISWHHLSILASLLLIICLLICLIVIVVSGSKTKLTRIDFLFLKLPFQIYLGWITVATIANVAVYLVSKGVQGVGAIAELITIPVLIFGLVIAAATVIKIRSRAYGYTVIWGYVGILIRHISKKGFAFEYPYLVAVCSVCILLLLFVTITKGNTSKQIE